MKSPILKAAAGVSLCLILGGCFGSGTSEPDAELSVQGARFALTYGNIRTGARTVINRPSASIGVFTGLYLAGGGFFGSTSARTGVMAQAQYHAKPAGDLDDTFALLTEFGTILGVDVADLLNRSADRTETMNNYLEGLQNITERAKLRWEELGTDLKELQAEQREARTAANALDREVRNALQTEDYATAGEKQPELAEAESKVAELDSNVRQLQDVIRTYDKLIEVADKRILAITENREILIAGQKVINVPGTESLGVLEEERIRSRYNF